MFLSAPTALSSADVLSLPAAASSEAARPSLGPDKNDARVGAAAPVEEAPPPMKGVAGVPPPEARVTADGVPRQDGVGSRTVDASGMGVRADVGAAVGGSLGEAGVAVARAGGVGAEWAPEHGCCSDVGGAVDACSPPSPSATSHSVTPVPPCAAGPGKGKVIYIYIFLFCFRFWGGEGGLSGNSFFVYLTLTTFFIYIYTYTS